MAEIAERAAPAAPTARLRRKFYVAMAVLMVLMIVIGFWPSYFGPLLRGASEAPWILHLHGAIYMSWMFLLWMILFGLPISVTRNFWFRFRAVRQSTYNWSRVP